MKIQEAVSGYILFKSTSCSPRTIDTAKGFLKQFIAFVGDIEVKEITKDHVREYIESLKARKLSGHTVRRHYAVLSSLYTWLTDSDIELANINVIKQISAPKEPKTKIQTYSEDDVKAMLEACKRTRHPRRAKALILFLLDSGARATETASVKMQDVDFKTGKILVFGKGSKERYIYLGKRALQALWLYVNNERVEPAQIDGDFLFLTNEGYQFDRHSLRKLIVRIGEFAGVHAYVHKFRHSCAVQRLRAGMDLATLQHMLGHEHVQTTMQYLTSLKDSDTENKAKKTSPSDSWKL